MKHSTDFDELRAFSLGRELVRDKVGTVQYCETELDRMADHQRNAPPWLAVRLGLLAIAFLSSSTFIASMPDDFSHPSWSFLLELTGLVAVGVVFLLGFQKINPLSTATWEPPRWSSNPFTMRSPLAFFHLNAWLFFSLGLGCLLLGLTRHPRNWVWELPAGIGAGAWVGVKVISSFEQANDSDAV